MSDFMHHKVSLSSLNFPMKRDEEVCSCKTAIAVKKLIIRTVILSPTHTEGIVDFIVVHGLESRQYNQLAVAVEEYNKIPN